ncbi:MAG: hypothetical protein FJ290_10810 [Planctomycetes bacterium]|nr:hypothetical protein [Planctomycetota bacterium]
MTSGLLALLVCGATAEAGQWRVESDGGREDLVRQVAEALPRAQQELEEKLGLALRGHALAVLCCSTESFRRATPGIDHRHTLGVAMPADKVIYLNCVGIERGSLLEPVSITVRHEVSHLIVGEVMRRGYRRVPLWFDEGVAVWTSGKLPFYDRSDYQRAVAAGTLYPLAELTDQFPLGPTERGIAYEQSESAIRFLVESRGEEAIRTILQAAGRGVEFPAAFQQAVGMDLAAFEREWLKAIRPSVPWLSWLLHTVSLFGLMSLLALYSFWVYRRRRRRKYQEWEAAERAEMGGGNPWL